MPKIIEAIYENGVFKPLQKVDLKEGERVKIILEERGERRKRFLAELRPVEVGKVSMEEIKKIVRERYEHIL